jgi:pimeloyl-ACP methyl ester carboxylesterase
MALTTRVQSWEGRGERVRALDNRRIFVLRRHGHSPPILFLHGFPSCSYDWRTLLEEEALRDRQVLALDFLGFGLSDKPARRYSLLTQADLVEQLVARYLKEPPFLVAHDMGTSVANELFARQLEGRARITLRGAMLFNGSMLLHLATPILSQRLLRGAAGPVMARLSRGQFFRRQFGSVFSAAHPLSAQEADDQWSLIRHNDGNLRMHGLIAYMDERIRYADRWHGAIRGWPGELSLLWALGDPVAGVPVLRGLQELRPGVPVTELPGLGHYPQIEDPGAVAAEIARLTPGDH